VEKQAILIWQVYTTSIGNSTYVDPPSQEIILNLK